MTTIALLHSPLTSAAAWGRLPTVLRGAGHEVVVPEVLDDADPPFAPRYVGRAAVQLRAAVGTAPCVVVAHSGAGPLLGMIGFARRAAGAPVAAYAFVDAGLPPAGRPASRLELMAAEDAQAAAGLREHLGIGGRFPDWSDDDLAEVVADPGDRSVLRAGLRPRDRAFFTEPLPVPEDWPDAPAVYLQTSTAYAHPARVAALRDWPVRQLDLGHFAALTDPERTATALTELLSDVV